MGFVYFMSSGQRKRGGRKRIKIGKAADKAPRLRQLQAGNLDLIEVAAIETDDACACERHLHKKLRTRRVGREFYELTDAELEDALCDARTYLEEDVPLEKKVAQLAQEESNGQLRQPGDRERQIYEELVQATEATYLAVTREEFWKNQMKVAIGSSAGFEGLATWEVHTKTSFDAGAFKDAHPDLYESFRRPAQERRWRLL